MRELSTREVNSWGSLQSLWSKHTIFPIHVKCEVVNSVVVVALCSEPWKSMVRKAIIQY